MTTSIVGTPFHKYPATSGTGASTSISCSIGDVIVVLAFTNVTQPSACAVSGATATMARQCAVTSNNSGGNSAIFTGMVTGAGTATVSVTAAGATDLGWTVVVIRGLSSATAHKSGTAAPAANAATYTTSFTTTVQCSLVMGLGDESGANPFSSWLPSGSTQINLDTTHLDGSAYKLGQAAAAYTPGINSNSTSGVNVTIVAVALPETTGAATHTTSGALTGQGSSIAGTSVHKTKHTTTGALTGPGSTIAGTSVHKTKHTTSGALTGAGSTVAGTAKRFRTHPTSGALTGAGSAIAGTAKRFRAHPTSGALTGPGSAIAGAAAHSAAAGSHGTTGALVGAGALLAGVATRIPGAAQRPSGGYLPAGRRRTKEEIRAERIAYGILREAPEVVRKVAETVIEAKGTPLELPRDEQAELLLKMIADDRLTSRNTVALNAAIVQVLEEEIERLHEERAIVQLLMEL